MKMLSSSGLQSLIGESAAHEIFFIFSSEGIYAPAPYLEGISYANSGNRGRTESLGAGETRTYRGEICGRHYCRWTRRAGVFGGLPLRPHHLGPYVAAPSRRRRAATNPAQERS